MDNNPPPPPKEKKNLYGLEITVQSHVLQRRMTLLLFVKNLIMHGIAIFFDMKIFLLNSLLLNIYSFKKSF